MNLKNGKVFTSKFFGTGPLLMKKRIYRAAVSQRLRNTELYGRSVEAAMLSTVPMALLLQLLYYRKTLLMFQTYAR